MLQLNDVCDFDYMFQHWKYEISRQLILNATMSTSENIKVLYNLVNPLNVNLSSSISSVSETLNIRNTDTIECRQHLHWKRKNDGGIFLRRYGIQCLKISQLQSCGWWTDCVCCLLQGLAWLLLPLSSYNFSSGLSGCFSFSCHGSLQVFWNSDILHLNSLNSNSPRLCCHFQWRLEEQQVSIVCISYFSYQIM